MAAVIAAQWAPLMTAAACIPTLAFFASAKPNIGISAVAYDPSRRVVGCATVGSIVLLAVSFALRLSWVQDWLPLVHKGEFSSPIALRGGQLLVLALLRWRRSDARLLMAVSLFPHSMVPYASLPLFLIPRTFRESLVLAACSSAAMLLTLTVIGEPKSLTENYHQGEALVALTYIPCLIMILRRPNEGERLTRHTPERFA